MVRICPRTMTCEPRGSNLLARVDDLINLSRDPAQIAALHRAVNVDHRLNVVVRNERPCTCRCMIDATSAQNLAGAAGSAPVTGIFSRSCSDLHAVLRRLRRDRCS